MSDLRTPWHVLFFKKLEEEKVPVERRSEIILGHQQRVDVFMRKEEDFAPPADCSFPALWEVMPKIMVVEYKSRAWTTPGQEAFHQLLGYGHLAARKYAKELHARRDLAATLVVGDVGEKVKNEAEKLGLTLEHQGRGLHALLGSPIRAWVLDLNEAADHVNEPLLGILGTRTIETLDREGERWLAERYMTNTELLEKLPGADDLREKILKSEVFNSMMHERLRKGGKEAVRKLLAGLGPEEKRNILEGLRANDESNLDT